MEQQKTSLFPAVIGFAVALMHSYGYYMVDASSGEFVTYAGHLFYR